MNLNDIVEASAEALKGVEELANVPIIVENKGDIANRLESSIAKKRVAIIVGWNGFNGDGNSSRTVFGSANLTVSVFEQPTINRMNAGAPTLLNMAREIAVALNLFKAGDQASPLVFRRITRIQELDDKTIACDVEFDAKATL